MTRSTQTFPEAMLTLQQSISEQGYQLSRVQRVDIGLTASGFITDKYRVVFLGKTDEIHQLSEQHPELIPYLPLKIAIFAENDETVLVTVNPSRYASFFPDPELHRLFRRWERDIRFLMEAVRRAE
jgi:uncharacterized protein (DUF302 family)